MSTLATTRPTLSQATANALTGIQGLLRHAVKVIGEDTRGVSRTTRETAGLMAAAWAVMVIGGVLVCFAVVFVLVEVFPAIPLFAWFGVVGVPTLICGGVLFSMGRVKLDAMGPLHQSSAELAAEAGVVAEKINDAIESTKQVIHTSAESANAKIDALRNATDLHLQVEQRPWLMFAAAAGVGYAGGMLLNSTLAQPSKSEQTSSGEANEGPGFFAKMGDILSPQMELLREVALAALFNVVRDFAQDLTAKPASQSRTSDANAPVFNTKNAPGQKENSS